MRKSVFFLLIECCMSCSTSNSIEQDEMVKISESFHNTLQTAMPDKNLNEVLKLYEDDAIYLPLSGPILKGKENISKGYARTFSSNLISFKMERKEISGNKDLLIEVGIIKATFQRDTVEMEGAFKYLNAYRKQSDGSYKMHRAIYNVNQN